MFYGKYKDKIKSLISPDITTNGVLNKMWVKQNDGKIILIKDSFAYNTKEGRYDESVHEVAASNIAYVIGVNAVEYRLLEDETNSKMYCSCKSFVTDDQTEFVSLRQYQMEDRTLTRLREKEFVEALTDSNGTSLLPYVRDMMLFDYLIANNDRHDGNVGVLRDAETLQIIGLSPLFDHGASLSYNRDHNRAYKYDPKFFTDNKQQHLQNIKEYFYDNPIKVNYNDIIDTYQCVAEECNVEDTEIDAVTNMLTQNIIDLDEIGAIENISELNRYNQER